MGHGNREGDNPGRLVVIGFSADRLQLKPQRSARQVRTRQVTDSREQSGVAGDYIRREGTLRWLSITGMVDICCRLCPLTSSAQRVLHEALGHGIVIGASWTTHAGLDTGGLYVQDASAAGRLLDPPIGQVDQFSSNDIAIVQRHLQRTQCEVCREIVLQRPAHHFYG